MRTITNYSSRVAVVLATGFGLGHLPIAPGTWGALGSATLYVLLRWSVPVLRENFSAVPERAVGPAMFLVTHVTVVVVVALVGVWASGRAADHLGVKDPGVVVIDEIVGQQIAYLGLPSLEWKYLLAGFLLFRAFDIWKPFPARQVESWRGGWGIMADDWFAGLYAALALWLMRRVGG